MKIEPRTLHLRHRGFRFPYQILGGHAREISPVLLLGGAFQTMRSLRWFASALLHRTTVLLADLPGSGKADPLPPEHGGEFLAECIVRMLDRHEIPRVHAVGVSFGSAIAYSLAQRTPERVDRLVLLGTMSHVDACMRAALTRSLRALASGDLEAFADQVSRVLLNHAERDRVQEFARADKLLRRSIARMGPQETAQFRVTAQRLLTHRRLDLTRPPEHPTLICTGEYDPLTTPARCQAVAQHLPHASVALIARSDHLAPLERPDAVLRLVDRFLRGLDLGAQAPDRAAEAA